MTFLTPIVISEKIHNKNSLLKFKSFTASFSLHATVFGAILYFVSAHPITVPLAEKITISLADFSPSDGDINRLESSVEPKKNITQKQIQLSKPKESSEPLKQTPHTVTTPERMPSLTPSVSSEASAPLAQPTPVFSTPPSSLIDSPHESVSSKSENVTPKNPVSSNEIGGAAYGHIKAMIENAITYPTIARKLRLEGVVTILFTLNADGTIEIAKVTTTSGSNILDKKALDTILSLSGDYPKLGKRIDFNIPISFNLHKS